MSQNEPTRTQFHRPLSAAKLPCEGRLGYMDCECCPHAATCDLVRGARPGDSQDDFCKVDVPDLLK